MRWPAHCLGLALLLTPLPVLAQAYQCRMPEKLVVPPMEARPADEARRQRSVTGYTLALSWSPEFCRTRRMASEHRFQCSQSYGEFGFILHGLWPESDGGGYPQWCTTSRPQLTSKTLRRHSCLIPSPRLMAHEWQKHGVCMASDPDAYFDTAAKLFGVLQFPEMERLSRSALTQGMLKRELMRINPGLKRDSIKISANARGWLEEVQLCLDRRFKPRSCPTGRNTQRGDTRLRIWRGL